MNKLLLILPALLAAEPAGWCGGYVEKPDTYTNYITEPILPPGTPAAQKPGDGIPFTEATIPSMATCRRKCCPTATSNPTTVTG